MLEFVVYTHRVLYIWDPHEPGVVVGQVLGVPGDVVGRYSEVVNEPKMDKYTAGNTGG